MSVFVETISNPLLRVADLDGLAEAAADSGVPLVVDNTFAPLLCRPIERGATLVAHSATKMIGGHSDLTLGVLVGPRAYVDPIRIVASTLGQTGNPFESWLALRGLATLSVRMERASRTALELAKHFEEHRKVNRTFYPGLESHPEFALAARLLEGGSGAMVTIDLGSRAGPNRSSRTWSRFRSPPAWATCRPRSAIPRRRAIAARTKPNWLSRE